MCYEEDMDKYGEEQLQKKISELESINDQLTAELRYLDGLLREIGFEGGIASLKRAAEEIMDEDQED